MGQHKSGRFWIFGLLFGLGLLAAFWAFHSFYNRSYFTEVVPTWGNVMRWMQTDHEEFLRDNPGPIRRVLAFVVIYWSILFLAGGLLGYEYVRYLVMRDQRRERFLPYRLLRFVILTIGGAGTLCLLYGYWVEPHWLEVTKVRIASAKLAHGSQIRLALFSDLHMAREVRLEPRLLRAIADQKPDLIVFCGDAMNSSWALGRFKQFLLEASQIAPVFLVKGNQDGGPYWDAKDIYKGTNSHELAGQVETLNVRGARLWLRGAADSVDYETLAKNPPPSNQFSIFVHHRPDEILEVARDRYDLYLCGHTHGGQVALPFYGALITYSKFDKQFEAGLYRVGATSLYVNRGIGFAKWPQPQARFFARPELTVIDLVGN